MATMPTVARSRHGLQGLVIAAARGQHPAAYKRRIEAAQDYTPAHALPGSRSRPLGGRFRRWFYIYSHLRSPVPRRQNCAICGSCDVSGYLLVCVDIACKPPHAAL